MTPTTKQRSTVLALLLAVLPPAPVMAESGSAQSGSEWTVVTLARDGSWGVGNAEFYGPALASALRKCEAMSDGQSDCGAEVTAIRKGWTLGMLCGDHRILIAEAEMTSAIMEAQARELYLRDLYGESVPPCQCVFWVDPQGFAAASRKNTWGAARK